METGNPEYEIIMLTTRDATFSVNVRVLIEMGPRKAKNSTEWLKITIKRSKQHCRRGNPMEPARNISQNTASADQHNRNLKKKDGSE